MQVFDPNNPYLHADEQYATQMRNVSWLLGLPFEIFVRIDSDLPMNEQKDDLMKDSLMRDMFYGSVHVEIALELLSRFEPGLTHCISEVDRRVAAGEVDLLSSPGTKRAARPKTKAAPRPTAAAAAKKTVSKKRSAPASPPSRPRQQRRPQARSPSGASTDLQVTKEVARIMTRHCAAIGWWHCRQRSLATVTTYVCLSCCFPALPDWGRATPPACFRVVCNT